MATGFYIGSDGKARKIKGVYIGVDGMARKVKKGYIGDENGVARLCWSEPEPLISPFYIKETGVPKLSNNLTYKTTQNKWGDRGAVGVVDVNSNEINVTSGIYQQGGAVDSGNIWSMQISLDDITGYKKLYINGNRATSYIGSLPNENYANVTIRAGSKYKTTTLTASPTTFVVDISELSGSATITIAASYSLTEETTASYGQFAAKIYTMYLTT